MVPSEKSGAVGRLTRRAFVGASAVGAAALAAGCAPEAQMAETGETETVEYRLDAEFDESAPGEWKPVQCWMSCGGKCLLQAHVVDGVITRIKTDDIYEDTTETFQNRGCLRGRSQRHARQAANRLKYPMKRKHWAPGGGDNVNGQLRGEDEWERISWDEAYDMIAGEMKRIYDTYGPRSVMHLSFPRTTMRNFVLAPMGGCTIFDFCDSYGTFMQYSGNLGLYFNHDEPGAYGSNDRLDMLKSDYIVMQGGNPAWASAGSPMLHFQRACQAGAEAVYIGPEYNVTASALDARWIPVRPGTDTALLLAVAYEMLRLEEERGDIIDWDFLDRCTVGFDSNHMPADATTNQNIRGYILGEYDGVPKTPEWATEICGTETSDITWLAEVFGKNNAVTWIYSYSPTRCNGAENMPQLQETIACMGGHHGKPGHSAGPQYHFFAGNDGPDLVTLGNCYPKGHEVTPPANGVDDVILEEQEWSAVTTGEYEWFGAVVDYSNGKSAVQPVEKRSIDIRMLVNDFGNPLVVRANTNEGIKAFKKVDFVLNLGLVFTPTAQYSDICLPIATSWEDENGDDYHLYQQNRETLLWQQFGVVPAPYECKTDREIGMELGRRLGLDVDALYPYTGREMHLYRLINATVVSEDGKSMEPLVTITQEDIDAYQIRDIEPQEGRVTLAEMMEKGIYHVARKEGDNYGWIAYKDFVEDPEAHPLSSESGKIELYCQAKADIFAKLGWQDPANPVQPYANYIRPMYGYEDSFADWETKAKGPYPIQAICGHYLKRSHTSFDSTGYLREAFATPIFMNAEDAAARGIKTGDWVRVFNDAGSVVRQASVLETVMPGVCNHMHGSWFELDPSGNGSSINGGTNFLTDSLHGISTVQGYNTVLVEIEKYDDQSILPDVERPVVMPAGMDA